MTFWYSKRFEQALTISTLSASRWTGPWLTLQLQWMLKLVNLSRCLVLCWVLDSSTRLWRQDEFCSMILKLTYGLCRSPVLELVFAKMDVELLMGTFAKVLPCLENTLLPCNLVQGSMASYRLSMYWCMGQDSDLQYPFAMQGRLQGESQNISMVLDNRFPPHTTIHLSQFQNTLVIAMSRLVNTVPIVHIWRGLHML